MVIALSILPIALTILCGHLLVRSRVLPHEQWAGIETLSFRVLIPAVLIKSIAGSDLSLDAFGPLMVALLLSLTTLGLAVMCLRRVFSHAALPNPAFSTLFQTSTRWNAFIALAAAELFVGATGFALIAVGMAVLIPVINVINIIVLAAFGSAKASPVSVAKMVMKNPLVQACAIGIALNLTGLPLPEFALQTLDLIGRAALAVGILAVGSGIRLERLFNSSALMWLGVAARLIVSPALFLIVSGIVGLGQVETVVGVLIFTVPAASNGYIVATQMGGDADLYADILAWQTVLSMLILPLLMLLLVGG